MLTAKDTLKKAIERGDRVLKENDIDIEYLKKEYIYLLECVKKWVIEDNGIEEFRKVEIIRTPYDTPVSSDWKDCQAVLNGISEGFQKP